MKKTLLAIAILVVVLFAVASFRAISLFDDLQVIPAVGITAIDVDEAAAVQHFSEALRIPTISHDDRSHFDAQAFLDFHAFLQQSYPLIHQQTTRTVVNNYSLVYHLKGVEPDLEPVLFMSHMDVVPVEDITLDDWTYPAFSGTVADGVIWGRGAIDVKIGVVALMEALELLLSENTRPERDIYFAFGHDEEVGGTDGAAMVARHFEERGVRFDYVLDEGGAVTSGLNNAVDRPVAVIGVAEKGHANITLTVDAPGGHSSAPPRQTSLGVLSRAIVKLEDNPFPATLTHINQNFEYIGDYTSFMTRFIMGNQWLFAPLVKKMLLAQDATAAALRTTTAATMASASPKANILPKRAKALVNFRILPGETIETVKQRVVELIDDERVAVEIEYGNNPSPASPVDTRGFKLIASTIRGMDDDILVTPYLLQAGTDARHFYPLSANVYRFLMFRATGKTLQYVHGTDEQVPVDEYLQSIRFYYHLIRQSMAA